MIVRRALTGLASAALVLALSSAVQAEETVRAEGDPAAIDFSLQYQPLDGFAPAGVETKSLAASRVIEWVSSSQDNGALPFIVIDKKTATMFLFDAQGQSLGEAPVLIGVASGDDSSPGIGSLKLSEIGPAERTTPAGRFVAKYGSSAGGDRVLWVKFADSVAMHAVVTSNKAEQRRIRLLTPDAEDNRITFGCINVPVSFYEKQVRPLFEEEGGIVYVLPDTKPLEDVFPRLHMQPHFGG